MGKEIVTKDVKSHLKSMRRKRLLCASSKWNTSHAHGAHAEPQVAKLCRYRTTMVNLCSGSCAMKGNRYVETCVRDDITSIVRIFCIKGSCILTKIGVALYLERKPHTLG
jgi:hypothetical protein